MEIKEAIEILTDEKMVRKGWYNTLSKETQKIIDGRIAAFDMAISALEKQVEKKPYPDDDNSILACPYCGSGEYLHNPDGNENQYCGQCGQKIDWEVTE